MSGRNEQSEFHELSREECLELLASHHFGRVAVSTSHEAPLIRPVNYVFNHAAQSVIFRTARGSKLHALTHAAKAAFEIDGIDETARTGWSVIVQGVTEAITSPQDLRRAEQLGLDAWAPGEKPDWVLIRVGTVTGRRIALPRGGSSGASPD